MLIQERAKAICYRQFMLLVIILASKAVSKALFLESRLSPRLKCQRFTLSRKKSYLVLTSLLLLVLTDCPSVTRSFRDRAWVMLALISSVGTQTLNRLMKETK